MQDRLEESRLALEKKKQLAAKLLQRSRQRVPPPAASQEVSSSATAEAPQAKAVSAEPWKQVRFSQSQSDFWSRTTHEKVWPQPWTKGLTNALLEAADVGGVQLCFSWPAKLPTLPLVHALANLARILATDVRGIRTLMFPGTHATRTGLQSTLVDREQLTNLYRRLWVEKDGRTSVVTCTQSPSLVAALAALNDVRNWQAEISNPSLAELIPSFVFDDPAEGWTSTVRFPLMRTLSKVTNQHQRSTLSEQVKSEWGVPRKAPCALMVLHHSTKKDSWRRAIGAAELRGDSHPDVLLLDATTAASQSNYNAVKRIPNFMRVAHEQGLKNAGVVVVTDDPRTFFVLRAQLGELKLPMPIRCHVWAAEGEDVLMSSRPCQEDWKPDPRSNSNFSVGIVDRDASQVALAFQKLAQSVGGEESAAHRVLMEACVYVLRLSNVPAGYSDLTAHAAEDASPSFASQRYAWTNIVLAVSAQFDAGTLNNVRAEAETVLRRAESLVDSWNDGTPMAARLLAEVQRHANNGKSDLSIVLPSRVYVVFAHRYLRRKLETLWAEIENRIEWHTLSSVGKTLGEDRKDRRFVFVGINADVLRILLAHPHVPHGTAILVAYKQAQSTIETLTSMKALEAFKPYRGRIGLLMQELQRRLADVPNPLVMNRLADVGMTFRFRDEAAAGAGGEQSYYKFDLEGGGRAYASGWVYRYQPDEDPFFRRTPASSIAPGDFIFEMSDELRSKVEDSLRLNTDPKGANSSVVDPLRMLMRLYHDDIQMRCKQLFQSTKRSTLAKEIHARMVELDPRAHGCRAGRVYYWLDLQTDGDTRPHASKDESYFKIFCNALGIGEDEAGTHWRHIRANRWLSQHLGRELMARYAEILFQRESAATYRKVPDSVIRQLQQEALRCVYRVQHVVPPLARGDLTA
jgi:hypothetical protein